MLDGAVGSPAHRAEQTCEALDSASRDTMRRVMLRIISLEGGPAVSAPHDTIARSLAAHFAPELGATLPALTERILVEEPPDETLFRGDDRRALLGYAAYFVAISAVAVDVYRRLPLERKEALLRGELSFVKQVLLADMHRDAPAERRLPAALRERVMGMAADLVLAPLLEHHELLELHGAVTAAQLTDRPALLVGIDSAFAAGLPVAESSAAQILRDVDALNRAGALADGSVPLAIWLDNAATLAGPRREASVFRKARARLGGAARSR
jgi:Effector-associated domain 5